MRRHWAVAAAFLSVWVISVSVSAQVHYATGQNIAPVFEGWEHNPDGTYSMVFGYLNRNYEEEIGIPVGPDNAVSLGGGAGGDHGQPEYFYPRRQRFLFKVVVPANFDKAQKVVWTLTSHGKTDLAKGWLQPEWELSEGVVIENMGGGVPDPDNKPPSLTTNGDQTITLPSVATLTASSTDDGLPKPKGRAPSNPDRDSEPRRPRGVQIKWIQYRGSNRVTFDPAASTVEYGHPVELTSKVSFSAAGRYVLRATAFDGQLYSTHDVTVTVNPGNFAGNKR
jgi:hypothetical protein